MIAAGIPGAHALPNATNRPKKVFAVGNCTDVDPMEDSATQQSSSSATLRAAVMLLLLICIPAIAMFERPLRSVVRRLFQDGPENATTLAGAKQPSRVDGQKDGSAWPGPRHETAASESFAEPRAVSSPASPIPPSDPGLMPGPHGATPAWSETAPRVAAARNQPIEQPPWQSVAPSSEAPEATTFDAMHRRLEQLGATYYLLETWGRGSALYRFHCKMAIGENPNFTRQFEATDSDPMVAMRRVLDEVESWHDKRRY